MSIEADLPKWVWCIVGNIIDEHPYGESREIVHGTKQFSPGAKVYCLPVQWGDGYERIPVIGKPRKKRGLIRVVMRREYIENFRCKKVYSRDVIRRMYREDKFRTWGNSDEDRRTIQDMLRWLNYSEEEAEGDRKLLFGDEIKLSAQVQGHPETQSVLRIEHRRRDDGRVGDAWYGFYRFSDGEERPVGIVDWYSHWPEAEPEFDWHNSHHSNDFIYGICEVGIQSWDAEYTSLSNNGGPLYSWCLDVAGRAGEFQVHGYNCAPDGLPQLYHLLQAWGFPKVWSMDAGAPTAWLA